MAAAAARPTTGERARRGDPLSHRSADREEPARRHDADEARRQAFVRFGGVEYLKERTRDEYRPALLEDFLRDVRYGVRVLVRTKAFAIVAILTLGLGIGAATAIFSVVDGCCCGRCPTPIPIGSSA